MKKIILTVIISSLSILSFAQVTDNEKALRTNNVGADTTEGWKCGGMTNLQFTNTKLYNWAAGGENSVAFNGVVSLFANYKKGKNAWDNSLDSAMELCAKVASILPIPRVKIGTDHLRKPMTRLN